MLFPMAVFQLHDKNPYNKVYRANPVYLRYGYIRKDQITIRMPSGYQVEEMPPDTEEENEFGRIHLKHARDGALLTLERQRELKAYFFPVQYYRALREFSEKVRQRDAENVVLQKVEAQGH